MTRIFDVTTGRLSKAPTLLSGIFSATILNRSARNQHFFVETSRSTSRVITLASYSVALSILRWIVASIAAVVITMGLLFLMQTMIETGEAVIQNVASARYVDFVRVPREERIETRAEKPKKIMPEEMPEMLDPRQQLEPEQGGINIGYSMTRVSRDQIDITGLIGDFGAADGEYMPLVRVAPIYPQRARVRGIEGWVELEFTVTRMGTVTNIRVTASSNAMFESTAVRALEKFKYRPRIVNGQPVEVTGVQYRIVFKLDR